MAKKVWILERWIDRAGMEQTLAELKEYAESAEKEGDVALAAFKDAVVRYHEKMRQHHDGYWLGYVGRSNYKQFCWDAKESLRYWIKDQHESADRFRVVEGYIADDAKQWVNYNVAKINDGVMKYLLATM